MGLFSAFCAKFDIYRVFRRLFFVEDFVELHVEKIDFSNKLAERYVKALWQVATDEKCQNDVSRDMASIASMLEDEKAQRSLKTAIAMKWFAFKLIDEAKTLLGLSEYVYNFLRLLVKNNRTYLINDICQYYNRFLYEQSGRSKFYITVSSNYLKSDRDSIAAKIKAQFSPLAECVFLKGGKGFYGIRIQHKSKILDYSVESQMSRLLTLMRE